MNPTLSWLHEAVTWLLTPALLALVAACAIALAEAGLALGERLWGLRRLAAGPEHAPARVPGNRACETADRSSLRDRGGGRGSLRKC